MIQGACAAQNGLAGGSVTDAVAWLACRRPYLDAAERDEVGAGPAGADGVLGVAARAASARGAPDARGLGEGHDGPCRKWRSFAQSSSPSSGA